MFGPLTLADYERLLPGGLSFHRLIPIVRNYAGDVLIWDVNLILSARRCRRSGWASRAGSAGPPGCMPRRSRADAADLHLDASADSFAQSIDQTQAAESHVP